MTNRWTILLLLAGLCLPARAALTITPWRPIFKGIDRAVGTNCPTTIVTNNGVAITDSTLQVVNCIRIDLTDPDVRLFTTPRASNWVAESRETLSLSINSFVRNYKVQVASDANFYDVFPGGADPTSEGLPSEVHGFLMCTGQVVSPVDSQGRYASLLFTSNNVPSFNLNNRPPGGNLTGIYTAVTGFYPLLTNGVNVWALYFNDFSAQYPDPSIHNFQPRTAFGVSQNRRYLFMLTIDGRQPGNGGGNCGDIVGTCGATFPSSNGALDAETAMWLLQFGAWDAISMDGGGSTAMYMADCNGEPVALNHSSLLAGRCAERIIGCHFGAYAKPLPSLMENIVVSPFDTTATITWKTPVPAVGRVDFGPSLSYGASVSDSTPLKNHVFTLNNLSPVTPYYFLITSTAGGNVYNAACRFATTASQSSSQIWLLGLTNRWKYTTNNLDGVNWQGTNYNDASWAGPGPGVLYCETPAAVPAISSVCNTPLPSTTNTNGIPASGTMAPTYYFRTHFTFSGSPAGKTLTFSNYVDDGAVFYLNGTPIQWLRMAAPPSVINNATLTTGGACGVSEATCPDLFSISGPLVNTNLHSGDNVLAVEVHQITTGSSDIVFGSAVNYDVPVTVRPTLNILREGNHLTIYWNGSGFTLQQATNPGGPWSNVSPAVTQSTFILNSPAGTKFYQLRN